jgi:carboxypeptidase family protein
MTRELCFLLLVIGIGVPIQQRTSVPTSPVPTRVSITGTVVRAGTNEPIASVPVTLRPSGISILTDQGGKFKLEAPAGRYTLLALREGFVLQRDSVHGITEAGMLFSLNAGTLSNVVLSMIALPAIAGHTYFPNGEPLAAAVVQAYRWQYTPFGRRIKSIKTALTDDSGAYRLFWLPFGEYVVSASYNHREQRAGLGGRRLSANVPDPDAGFTTAFYGGGLNAAEAQLIRVTPGFDSGNFNIILSDTPRFSIRGQVVAAVPLPPDLKILFLPQGWDIDLEDTGNFVSLRPDGTFEITGISAGSYVMLAFGGHQSSPLVPVHVVNSNVEKLSIPVAPAVTVSGRVSVEGAIRTNLIGVRVSLVRSGIDTEMRIDARASEDGTFTAPDVGTGEYEVWVDRLPSGMYVRAIRFGGIDVLTGGMRVVSAANPSLDVTLSSTTAASLQGRALDSSGHAAGGVQVLLVPESRFRRRPDRYILGSTDAAGNFQLTPIPPGRYRAYAFEQIESGAQYAFAYDSPSTSPFADRAPVVNLIEGRATTVELKAIPATETAGGIR